MERAKDGDRSTAAAGNAAAELEETVLPAFTTVHLPPERAVVTTPALIGLLERCVTAAEATLQDGAVRRQSIAVELRHRAGLRAGEQLRLAAELEQVDGSDVRWRVAATAADGRAIADGWIARAEVH